MTPESRTAILEATSWLARHSASGALALLLVLTLASCQQILGITATDEVAPDSSVEPACTQSDQCLDMPDTPVCDADQGQCVQCLVNSHCEAQNGQVCVTGEAPFCGCADHGDCADTLVCKLAEGACAVESEVLYVNGTFGNDGADCGGRETECASVQTGIDRAKDEERSFVHVAAGQYVQEAMTIELLGLDSQLNLIGEGKDRVDILPMFAGMPVLTVSGRGRVTIDGIKLSSGWSTDGHGIDCTSGTLDVFRCRITNNVGIGIRATGGCNLTVRNSDIGNDPGGRRGNRGGGIFIEDGVFRLSNNMITDNGTEDVSAFGGVRLQRAATGILEFNTIVDNTKNTNTQPAGVQCKQIDFPDSVIASNNLVQGNSTPEQVDIMSCVWTHSALDPTAAAVQPSNNNTGDPCTLEADDTSRLAASDTGCVDKGDPAATVTTDLFGNVRPQGAAPDIGAHELK